MGKGDKRRPTVVTDEEFLVQWNRVFDSEDEAQLTMTFPEDDEQGVQAN